MVKFCNATVITISEFSNQSKLFKQIQTVEVCDATEA